MNEHDTHAVAAAPVLAVENLVKHFTLRSSWPMSSGRVVPAVDGISFELLPKQTLGLVGESGCGKSTTAKLVMQLEKPDGGEIRLDGETVRAGDRETLRRVRRKAQMVFQDPYASLTPHLRIGTILSEPFIVHAICPRRELGARVAAALSAVGLHPEIARRYPHELSGGQRQRVGIARAIAIEPLLVVCDEPVSALDVSIRSQIINLLLDLQQSRGLAYLFISHDLDLVEHVSDAVAVMYLGRIVEKAPTGTFFAGPRHPYSQALIASSPVADPHRKARPAIVGEVPGAASLPSGCSFRNRCPFAIERCAEVEPPLRPLADGRLVACHRAEETA